MTHLKTTHTSDTTIEDHVKDHAKSSDQPFVADLQPFSATDYPQIHLLTKDYSPEQERIETTLVIETLVGWGIDSFGCRQDHFENPGNTNPEAILLEYHGFRQAESYRQHNDEITDMEHKLAQGKDPEYDYGLSDTLANQSKHTTASIHRNLSEQAATISRRLTELADYSREAEQKRRDSEHQSPQAKEFREIFGVHPGKPETALTLAEQYQIEARAAIRLATSLFAAAQFQSTPEQS